MSKLVGLYKQYYELTEKEKQCTISESEELELIVLKSLIWIMEEFGLEYDLEIASANNDSKALKSVRIKLRIIREEMKNYEDIKKD